jgi:uncharacterized membrane protein (UPF0127 family)
VVLCAALLAAPSCAGAGEETTIPVLPTTPVGPTSPETPTTTAASSPSVSIGDGPDSDSVVLPGSPIEWEVREATLAGVPWSVAVADNAELRGSGLMGVTDLGRIDGMLFVYPEPVESRFWMRDTLLDLDIAFFDAAGRLLTVLAMEPCTAMPCPLYDPGVAFQWALEALPGRFSGLDPGAVLDIGS